MNTKIIFSRYILQIISAVLMLITSCIVVGDASKDADFKYQLAVVAKNQQKYLSAISHLLEIHPTTFDRLPISSQLLLGELFELVGLDNQSKKLYSQIVNRAKTAESKRPVQLKLIRYSRQGDPGLSHID